jgi:hypothetical protein
MVIYYLYGREKNKDLFSTDRSFYITGREKVTVRMGSEKAIKNPCNFYSQGFFICALFFEKLIHLYF